MNNEKLLDNESKKLYHINKRFVLFQERDRREEIRSSGFCGQGRY